MGTTAQHTGGRFKVVCAWCRVVMSKDAPKDAERMCADCFRRMLDGYARPLQQAHDHKASGR